MKRLLLAAALLCLGAGAFAQKQTVKDYYDKLKPGLEQQIANGDDTKLKIKTQDLANGYMLVEVENGVMDVPSSYEMALWRDSKGNPIIGIVPTWCGGEGCGSNIDELKFYNAEMQDITSKVFPAKDVSDYLAKQTKRDASNLLATIKIPQKGTTLTIKPRANDFPSGTKLPTAELTFNKTTAKFALVKK